MKILITLLLLVLTNMMVGQTLPEIKKNDERVFYNKMQNIISLDLNGSDPSLIKLKMRNGQIGKLNDSTYQINYIGRGLFEDELKVKLYYKNLPVDVYTMPAAQAPLVHIALPDTNRKTYTLAELSSLNLNIEIMDKALVESGYSVFSYQVRAILPKLKKPFPVMSINSMSLSKLKSASHKLVSGSKMIITDVRLINKFKVHMLAQSNYFEVLIK